MSSKKYLVIGGYVTSKSDGDRHYIGPHALMKLYNVNPAECITRLEEKDCMISELEDNGLVILRPRYDGNYTNPNMDNANV